MLSFTCRIWVNGCLLTNIQIHRFCRNTLFLLRRLSYNTFTHEFGFQTFESPSILLKPINCNRIDTVFVKTLSFFIVQLLVKRIIFNVEFIWSFTIKEYSLRCSRFPRLSHSIFSFPTLKLLSRTSESLPALAMLGTKARYARLPTVYS